MEYIKIKNQFQVKAYLSDGVKPIDVYYDKEIDKIVFIFKKEDTTEVWKKWKSYKYQGLYLECMSRIFSSSMRKEVNTSDV